MFHYFMIWIRSFLKQTELGWYFGHLKYILKNIDLYFLSL